MPGSYEHTTWGELDAQLSLRLGETTPGTHWAPAERLLLLREALRYFNSVTWSFRARGAVAVPTGTSFLDLADTLLDEADGVTKLLSGTVTDRDLITEIQYHFMEPATGSSWTGGAQFSLAEVVAAVERTLNRFLAETSAVLTRSASTPAPVSGLVDLPEDVIALRRVAWVGSDGRIVPLWQATGHALATGGESPDALATSRAPSRYSITTERRLRLQLIPPASTPGTLDLLYVASAGSLDPASAATVLPIPDDLAWGVKWGAIAELLDKDGPGRAPALAGYARGRYAEAVEIARISPTLLRAEINNAPFPIGTIASLDAARPDWQYRMRTQRALASASNFLAIAPRTTAATSVQLSVVRKAVIPTATDQFVQIGREDINLVVAYALHLAAFKLAGSEFERTGPLLTSVRERAIATNERLAASARYLDSIGMQSRAEALTRPDRWHRRRDVEIQS